MVAVQPLCSSVIKYFISVIPLLFLSQFFFPLFLFKKEAGLGAAPQKYKTLIA